ncbi:protein toll-like [Coccinella septempunctata]|uniref:protein toll-like n=1 Tax=Coccinella septempunctata TaxID=41139 RepID=UPI001D08D6C3|nr:protein toll-like [Coccinella septempunctata]
MHSIWVGIMLMILHISSHTQASVDDICKRTEKCNCINVISSGNLEFQCPPSSYADNKIIIHVYGPSKKMRIDCDHIRVFNQSILPEANFSLVKKLEFQECPLPENGFETVIKSFGLNNLEYLRFTEHALKKPLVSDDFKELNSLKSLELKKNNITVFDGRIFQNIPKLSDLMIDENKLVLDENIFEKATNLLILSINSNNIDHIPKKTFENLHKLEKLFLWQNSLKILEKGVFDSLINLKMLELSLNKIEILEDGIFDNSQNLLKLSLRRNNLGNISRRIFENCRSLELINIDENRNINFVDDVFSNFTHLKNVNSAYNELEVLSESLFWGSTNIERITLNNNRLKKLPIRIFQNLNNLRVLNLESNQLEKIDAQTFRDLENLEYLYLQHNQLKNIDEKLLLNMKNLKEINLSYNKIFRLPTQCLSRNKNLVKFSMSHNEFDFEEMKSFSSNTPFSSFSSTNLKEVDLSYNNITRYPYNLNGIATIEKIKLHHNMIGEITLDLLSTMNAKPVTIDLSFNNISLIEFMDLNQRARDFDHSRVDIEISNNPIFCDCNAFNLARYVQDKKHPFKDYLVLNYNEIECAGPRHLFKQSLEEVSLRELICNIDNNCTSNEFCNCLYQSSDKTLVVDCSGRSLRDVPELRDLSHYPEFNEIEVHLEYNLLERCPNEVDGYQNTSRWYLKGNAIRNITWIPETLKVLDLGENHLEGIDALTLKVLNESKLNNILLGNNPWRCDCGIKDFLIYLRDHIEQIDLSNITCNTTKNRLVDLSDRDLCPIEADIVLTITVFALFCLFIITSTLSLYFLYQKEILIWLYGRGYCLWLVKEDELDENKVYDAFISFSSKDEDFVIENIVSVLETGEEPYKLCIHFRDWIPGELIQTQIMNSVNNSRRTIVVLSANFLESVWGIIEFKTAHNEAMREGRARVIIIIYGDIDMEALDDDLKAYLKTNTYIMWGDSWFWDKLKYALPKRGGRKAISMKHANMMQYIEDKFKLIDKQTVDSVSTPVILTPKSLEENPLAR